jgi:hypothetical protein
MGDFSRDDWIVGALALLLAIDLLFLPWFSASATFAGVTVSASTSGTGSPDAWLGVLALISSIALIADLVIERSSPSTALPNIGGSRTKTRLALAGLTALFLVLKFLFNIHFSLFGFGFWAAVVLTAGLLFSTLRVSNDQPVLNTK